MDVGDGARRSDRDTGKRSGSGGGDEFGFAVSRIAVGQLCESVGFQSVQGSAVDTLADVAARYAHSVGRLAVMYANSSGRTDCNAVDVVQALGDLGAAQGFAGASDVHQCVIGSGVMRDILYYMSCAEEIPFARRIASFPVAGGRKAVASFAQSGEVLPAAHIPDWLPAFPDPSTYVHSSVENVGVCKQKDEKEESAGEQRNSGRSVLALKKWLAGNDGNASVSLEEGELVKGRPETVDGNPFLLPPLPFGEKEVSRLDFKDWFKLEKPERDSEALIPAVQVNNGDINDAMVGDRRLLLAKRSTVRFRLRSGKRSTCSSPSASKDIFCEPDMWVLENEDKNEKKMRNELVHGESMESLVEPRKMQGAL